jgi:mannose-1-phosphate guanylyltransferase/mannose-6-phosphate isomerase
MIDPEHLPAPEVPRFVAAPLLPRPAAPVHRPWGDYQVVDSGPRFQVKRLRVKPGEQLSLQRHRHRAEHWTVVSGAADVTIGAETFRVYENEAVVVPAGAVHRLANRGFVPLVVVEVQVGAYLGEDDIERLDDAYGRTQNLYKEIV